MDDESVKRYALRLADDALVLGHRLSEWSSRGPYLEEDLALTNVALDYLGRARLFYGYAVKLSDDGSTEDSFAYLRGCREFTNHLIHELPVGDFAFTMTRQYLCFNPTTPHWWPLRVKSSKKGLITLGEAMNGC